MAADQVQTMKIQINQNKLTTKDAIIFAVVIGIFGICCICGAWLVIASWLSKRRGEERNASNPEVRNISNPTETRAAVNIEEIKTSRKILQRANQV